VLVTILETTGVADEMGSEKAASARASSVLETAPTGTVAAVACVRYVCRARRASSLVVGSVVARAALAAPESKSAIPNERPSFETL